MTLRPVIAAALAATAFVLAALPATAQVYKWTGPDGRTHYGDRAPDEVKKQELRIGVQSFGGPAEVDIESSTEARREFSSYGGAGVPLIIVGEHRMRGFDAGAMDRMLAAARP